MMNFQNAASGTAGCTAGDNNMTNNGFMANNGMANSYMNGNRMNERELGDWVAMLGFCAYDMLLYMDTHPDDANALDYFNQCTDLYNSAKKAYEERCGQLNAFSGGPLSSWDWNTAPMPWEGGR